VKLRNKVLIAISVTWAVFLGVSYFVSNTLLLQSFTQIERDRVNRDLSRVNQALDQFNYSLYTFTSDWSHWNDAYAYLQDKNPSFIKNNFNMTAFVNSSINLISYWNLKGKMILGEAIDTDHKKIILFPTNFKQSTFSDVFNSENTRGYLLVNNQIMLIAKSAVTDGNQKKPPNGMMITGRILSPQLIQRIEHMTRLNIQLLMLTDVAGNPLFQKAFDISMATATLDYIHPIDKQKIEGFSIIKDIMGKPIGLFRIISDRSVYNAGLNTIHYYLIGLIFLGLIFFVLMSWLVQTLIIKRLEQLDKEVVEISTKQEVTQRVHVSDENDELSSVSKEINSMMDTIQTAQEQLEQRVKQRTHELEEANIQLQHEITERKSAEQELIINKEHLVRLAHYDNLTSLPNRVFFNEILNKTLSHASRQHKILAILFVDLDRFKNINDALGHNTGDLVLKELANRFTTVLRAGDIIARLGGDEFIILLNDIQHPKFASPVAEKIIHACAQPVKISNHEFFITASIGICIFPHDGTSLEDLQRNADMAMYKAKRSGGGVFQYFTKEMNVEAHQHIQLEAALRKAISNNEFVLFYQPKLDLKTNSILGVEALIRWDHPELGLVSPAGFIPLAEETGLIMQIGEWALREACNTAKNWQAQGYQPICVSVNLSPRQFRHQDIAQLVASILKETGLDPKYLELEITETAVMDDVETAIVKLTEIQQMGVGISVDDFGTGYTSISYLKRFPINILKIDQTFIKGIPTNLNDVAITSAVIAMAHNLGIKVVAEGVETAEQLQYLVDHYCDMIQGYFLSRPLPDKKVVLQFTKVDSVGAAGNPPPRKGD
jgi:diguanylate cyclase (GGDEF)-like protein